MLWLSSTGVRGVPSAAVTAICGAPFSELLTRERLAHAELFLRHTDYRIGETPVYGAYADGYYSDLIAVTSETWTDAEGNPAEKFALAEKTVIARNTVFFGESAVWLSTVRQRESNSDFD